MHLLSVLDNDKNYIENLGYSCIEHRYRTPYGEIDLVFKNANSLLFVEVKARKKIYHLEVIQKRQIQRIKDAISDYMAQHPEYGSYDYALDIVIVSSDKIIEHIKNIYL